MKVLQYHPFLMKIDGEEIAFRVKRQTVEESTEYQTRLARTATPTALRFMSRESSGPEQDRNENGAYKITLEQLAEIKIPELPPEELERFRAAQAEDEKLAQEFLKWAFAAFITVEKGLVEVLADASEKTVSDGIDVLRLFGARRDVLAGLLSAISEKNTLADEEKKISRSESGFSSFSTDPDADPGGRKLETVVEPAETEVFVGIEDV